MKNRRKFLVKSLALGGGILALSPMLNASQSPKNAQNTKIPIANTSQEAARNAAKNPFGLVYENALSKNEKGKVQIQSVSYESRGLKIKANVYTPPSFNLEQKFPAIVVAHPNGGVKEQVAGLYAQNLAELGYITLAFDAAYQGASGGIPRNIDTPYHRTEDIYAALDFLSKFQGVDKERLGILGICGGGGYTLNAAKADKRLKAVATLSMFNTGRVRRNGFLDADKENIQTRLTQASQARQKESLTGEISYTGSAPKKLSEEELNKIPAGLYREGRIYYGDTHAHPNSTSRFTTSSLSELIPFDATNQIELINAPLLLIVGDKADTAYMSEEAFKKANGAKNKEIFKLKDSTHIQTYYEPRIVQEALKKLEAFYKENL